MIGAKYTNLSQSWYTLNNNHFYFVTLSFLLEQTNEHLIQGALISSQNTRLHAWLGKAASPPFGTVSFLPVMHVVYYQNLEKWEKNKQLGERIRYS